MASMRKVRGKDAQEVAALSGWRLYRAPLLWVWRAVVSGTVLSQLVLLPTSGQRWGGSLSGSGLQFVTCAAKVRCAFLSPFPGKYLNVVRECGHDVTCPAAKEVIYTLKERAYVEQIEKAFGYASKVLLGFLMEEKELIAHLRCVASSWREGARGPSEVRGFLLGRRGSWPT